MWGNKSGKFVITSVVVVAFWSICMIYGVTSEEAYNPHDWVEDHKTETIYNYSKICFTYGNHCPYFTLGDVITVCGKEFSTKGSPQIKHYFDTVSPGQCRDYICYVNVATDDPKLLVIVKIEQDPYFQYPASCIVYKKKN